MANNIEVQKGFRENFGRRTKNVGIVIAVLGLILSPGLLLGGAGIAVSGRIFEGSGKKPQQTTKPI
jgi:hypothetical protein